MGLLDDAIREHLELKRQHGADPDEVAREEREALGPARGAEPDVALGEPGEPASPEEPEDVGAVAASEAAREDEPPETEEHAPAEPADQDEDPWLEDEEPARPAEEEEPKSEDVLEETPEFLQETPEHDRLWFEQKPPRDFDWDG
jgi:hypothetical protein